MKRFRQLLVLSAALALFAACDDDGPVENDDDLGGGGGGGGGGGAVDFTGTWKGIATEDKGGGPYSPTLTFVLTQSGTTVTGTFVDSITPTYADSGSVGGSVAGDSAIVVVTLNDPPPITRCSGALPGVLKIVGGQLVGGYEGRDCDYLAGGPDPNRTATFTLDKQ